MGEDIDVAAGSAGHRVLARVIMSTHFHIILKQGGAPLGWMMQRVMQRAWIRVKKQHGVRGHVFESRYWAEPIPTSQYLRRAIVYTHLNPCEALICSEPSLYEWSSHKKYVDCAAAGLPNDVGFSEGLLAFADLSLDSKHVVKNYLRFVEFCQARRRQGITGDWLLPGSAWFPDAPIARYGDAHWLNTYTHFDGSATGPKKTVDARTVALAALARIDRNLDIDILRFGPRLPQLREPRRQLVCAMLSAGCRPSVIARFLNISPSVVATIKSAMAFSATQER